MGDSETVPMDVTAEQASRIVRAAVVLVKDKYRTGKWLLNREEWKLVEAVEDYGLEFKGIRSQ